MKRRHLLRYVPPSVAAIGSALLTACIAFLPTGHMEGPGVPCALIGLAGVYAVQLARLIWARPGHYTPDAADYFLFFAGNWITFCVLFYAMVAIWYLGGVLVRRLKKNPK